MNLSDLLEMGIAASLDGNGRLLIDAPKGVLTTDLIERIRHHKPGLIAAIGGARDLCEVGELHRLCANPAGKGATPEAEVRCGPASSRWLLQVTDRDPMEVWFAPAVDHVEALTSYPDALAAEPLAEVRTPVCTETTVKSCRTCKHCKRPGLSAGYCGGDRDDLPGAYGLHHPLRQLPADGGAGCGRYTLN